jgi:hypothetical protein
MALSFIPKVIYGAGPTTYNFLYPQKLWVPSAKVVGGSNVSEAGVPETFIIRRDQFIKTTIRFSEAEWADVDAWLAYAQAGNAFDFYFDQNAIQNELLWSQDLTNAVWVKTRATVSGNIDIAPDGTLTGDRLVEDATAANSHTVSQNFTITANATLAASIYLKAGTRQFIRIKVADAAAGSNGFLRWVNLSTMKLGTSSLLGTGTLASSVIEQSELGWYRLKLIGAVGNAVTAAQIGLWLSDVDGGSSYNGDGVSYATVWGAQVQQASAVGQYLFTQSAVNRLKYTVYLEDPKLGDGDVTPSREPYSRMFALPVTMRTTTNNIFDVRIAP